MSNELTLAQLAAEVAQLRQQVEESNRRLDMIYGAINRLAEVKTSQPSSNFATPQPLSQAAQQEETKPDPQSAPVADLPLSARMLMGPDTMLDSLHQYGLKAGLTLSLDGVERLKSELQGAEAHEVQ
jgi:hypothetical protein